MEIITAIRLKGFRVTREPTIGQMMSYQEKREFFARVLGKDAFNMPSIMRLVRVK